MSQRVLIPSNLFYHWVDPMPPDYPQPSTGDIYFNVSTEVIRVFYAGGWHDGGGADLQGPAKMIVEPAPATGIPAGGEGTVWIEY